MARIAWTLTLLELLQMWASPTARAVDSMPKPFDPGECKGTSVFEKAIQANGGTIPDTIDGVTELMADKLGARLQGTAIDVGDSRSLERDYARIGSPRSIRAFQRISTVLPSGTNILISEEDASMVPIWIGEAPSARQLEGSARWRAKRARRTVTNSSWSKVSRRDANPTWLTRAAGPARAATRQGGRFSPTSRGRKRPSHPAR